MDFPYRFPMDIPWISVPRSHDVAVGAERMKSSALLAAAAKGTVPWRESGGRHREFAMGNSDGEC